jgi:hypothetical protein
MTVPAFPTPSLSAAYDPAPQRERMRGILALLLLILVAVEVALAFLLAYLGKPVEPLRDVLSLIFGATTTLLGSALGFYFGERSGRRSEGA